MAERLQNGDFDAPGGWVLGPNTTFLPAAARRGNGVRMIAEAGVVMPPPEPSVPPVVPYVRRPVTVPTGVVLSASVYVRQTSGLASSFMTLDIEDPAGSESWTAVDFGIAFTLSAWTLLSGTYTALNPEVTWRLSAAAGSGSSSFDVDDGSLDDGLPIWTILPARSTTLDVPEVDQQLLDFRAECFEWEAEAERLGRVVTIDADPDKPADFLSIGAALRKHAAAVTPSTPMIFQFGSGYQVPPNTTGRGDLADYVECHIDSHPGGIVLRGKGPETRWFNMQDWHYYESGGGVSPNGPLFLVSSRVFVRDFWLGRDYAWQDPTEPCRARLKELDPTPTGGLDYDVSVLPGVLHVMQQQATGGSRQSAVFVYNCQYSHCYDMWITENPAPSVAHTLPVLSIMENCTVYGGGTAGLLSDPPPVYSNSDGFAPQAGWNLTWLKNVTFAADITHRTLWANFTTGSQQPNTVWFDAVDLRYGTIGYDNGHLFVGGRQPSGGVNRYIFRDSRLIATADVFERCAAGGFPYPTLGESGFIQLGPWIDGRRVDFFAQRSEFGIDLTGYDVQARAQSVTQGPIGFSIRPFDSGPTYNQITSSTGYNIYVVDCPINLRGSSADLAWYTEKYIHWPGDGVIEVS